MPSSWARIRVTLVKEATQILRDRRALTISLGLPVMLLVLFGFGVSLDIAQVPLLVCDRDQTTASRTLVRRFTASGYFTASGRASGEAGIEDALRGGWAQAALVIPEGYGRALSRRDTVPVQLVLDGSDSNTATIVRGHALNIFQQTAVELLNERAQETGPRTRDARGRATVMPIELRSRVLYNPNLESRNYFVPGLIGILMTMMGVLLPAISIVREEELGTLEALRVTPLGAWELMVGKLAPYCVIGFLDLILVLIVGGVLFGMPVRGSLPLLLLGSLLLLLAALGLGLLISTLASTQQGAVAAAFVGTILPVMYLSDFIFTVRSLPAWLNVVSYLVPARYYLAIVRGIVQKGVGLESLGRPFAFLAAYAGVLLLLGGLAIRRKIR
jgi:ABC-2 type transport system permease protein